MLLLCVGGVAVLGAARPAAPDCHDPALAARWHTFADEQAERFRRGVPAEARAAVDAAAAMILARRSATDPETPAAAALDALATRLAALAAEPPASAPAVSAREAEAARGRWGARLGGVRRGITTQAARFPVDRSAGDAELAAIPVTEAVSRTALAESIVALTLAQAGEVAARAIDAGMPTAAENFDDPRPAEVPADLDRATRRLADACPAAPRSITLRIAPVSPRLEAPRAARALTPRMPSGMGLATDGTHLWAGWVHVALGGERNVDQGRLARLDPGGDPVLLAAGIATDEPHEHRGPASRRLWPTPLPGDVVIAADESARPTAWTEDGRRLWTLDGELLASPAVIGNDVVLALSAGEVLRVDRASGVIRWSRQLGPAPGTPLVADDTVYVVDSGGILAAIDGASGDLRWTADVPLTAADVVAGPELVDGMLVSAVADGDIVATDMVDGQRRWEVRGPDEPVGLIPGDHAVVVMGVDTTYTRITMEGTVAWSRQLRGGGAVLRHPPAAVADGFLVATSYPGLLAHVVTEGVDAPRVAEALGHPDGGGFESAPLVMGDRVWVVDAAGKLLGFGRGCGRRAPGMPTAAHDLGPWLRRAATPPDAQAGLLAHADVRRGPRLSARTPLPPPPTGARSPPPAVGAARRARPGSPCPGPVAT
jgi:hypothetical protein